MNVIKIQSVDNFDELRDLMTDQAQVILDEVPEELKNPSYQYICDNVLSANHEFSCDFSDLWDFIVYDFDIADVQKYLV